MAELSPTLRPRDLAAWRAWLTKHHHAHRGLFLVLAKKHVLARRPGLLTYEQAVEEALCFGWIDGLAKYFDADWRALRFSPRRDDSIWSEPNKRRVARLIRAGRMTPAGLRLVKLAKQNGEWAAARRREALVEPPELSTALEAAPAALAWWRALAPGQRKLWLYWVTEAKRPETKARRVAAVVRECLAKRKPGAKTPAT